MGSTQSKGFSSSESTNGDSRCDVDSVKEMEFQDIEDWLHLNHKEYQHFNEPHKVDYVITDAIFALNHATEESLKSRKEAKSELREAFSLSDFDVQQAEEKAAQKEPPQVTINIEVIRVEGLKPKNKGYNLSIYIPGKIKPTDTNLEEYQGDAENVLRNTYCTIAVEDQKFTSPTVNASLNPEYNYPVHILKKQMRPYTTTISIWESITRREDAIHKTDDRRKSVQADKLLGYVNIDIKNDKIDGWYELKNHKDNEEIKYRGKIYVRISSFIEMKTSIGGREGYLILYKKLIANSLRERCRPGVTSCITDDSTCIKQEGDEKQSAKCLNQETLSDAARLILKQYSCVTSLHSSEVATAQWRICSNFANVDHKFMLKCIEEISSFSEITLTDEEQKVLSSANKMCYSICLKKIKDLTKNFPFVFGDDGSQEIWKVQLENMLRCMKLLCSKTILSESLLEDIQQALTEHTHSLWDKSLAEEPRNFTNTYDRNSEEQMLLKESSLAEKCGGFLEVVHTFYQPVFKREINMSHQKIVHQIVSKNVADRVQPILKRLYKGGRRKSRENWQDPLSLEPGLDYTKDTPAYKLFKRIKIIESFSEIQEDSALYSYHTWFSVGLDTWREIITDRLTKAAKKEVEKDDFTEGSNSSQEIIGLINITKNTWKQFGPISNEYGFSFSEKVLADIVSVFNIYRKAVKHKLKENVEIVNNESPPLQMCNALNNLEKIYHRIKTLPDDFKVDRNNEVLKEPISVQMLSQKIEETMKDFLSKYTQQHEEQFTIGIKECCISGSDTLLFNRIKIGLDQFQSNFSTLNCTLFFESFWSVLIRSFKNVIEENSRIRQPDFFVRGYQLLIKCKKYLIKKGDNVISAERTKTKDYIAVETKLRYHRLSTLKLMSKHFKEQFDYQENAESIARVHARIQFNEENKSLHIQIPMVDNIGTESSHLSSYIAIHLVPQSHFVQTPAEETRVETGTQQVYEYDKQIYLNYDDPVIKSGYVQIVLKQKKYPFKANALACAVFPIKSQDNEARLKNYKMVKPMNLRESEVLKTLAERKEWDKEASNFLQCLDY